MSDHGGVCKCLSPASSYVCDDCPSVRTPTDEGRRRYPETDGYYDEVACTCGPACPTACKGDECKCAACSNAYFDAIDYD